MKLLKPQSARAELLVKMFEGCDEYPVLKKLILEELITHGLETDDQLSILEKNWLLEIKILRLVHMMTNLICLRVCNEKSFGNLRIRLGQAKGKLF